MKKGSIKINAILYKFGHSLKVCSKTELQKLKYKKLYLPDVIEDGGVWKSKGRNRVVKWITGILCLAVHIKIYAILYKFG